MDAGILLLWPATMLAYLPGAIAYLISRLVPTVPTMAIGTVGGMIALMMGGFLLAALTGAVAYAIDRTCRKFI